MRYKAEIYYCIGEDKIIESVFTWESASDQAAKKRLISLKENVSGTDYKATHVRLFGGADKIFEAEIRSELAG